MDSYYNSDKFKNKLHDYESYLEGSSLGLLDADDLSDIAQYYYEKNLSDKAFQAIDVALEFFPGSIGPLAFKARYALFKENNVDKAVSLANEIVDKEDPDYMLLKAEILLVDKGAEEADHYLEDFYDSFDGDDYHDDMPLDVAMLFADYEEWDFAEKWLMRSDETDEDDYKDVLSEVLIGKGKFSESEEIINDLIDRNPYSTDYWDLLAKEKYLSNNFTEAISACDYSLAINPDDSYAIINKANSMFNLGNYEEAKPLLRRYIQMEPNRDAGFLMLGLTCISLEEYQEARNYLSKALEVNENNVNSPWQNKSEILYQLAFVEDVLGHYSSSHHYLDLLEDLYKDYYIDDVKQLKSFLPDLDCAHGLLYLEEDNVSKAAEWFGQAVIDSDSSTEIYVKIAASAYECGYVKYSYNILHHLLTDETNESPLGYIYLAKCCKLLGYKKEEAWAIDKYSKNDIESVK